MDRRGIEAGRLLLRAPAGRSCGGHGGVLADPSPGCPAREAEPAACGPLLDSLTDGGRGELAARLRHVREVLTGYALGDTRSGGAGRARPEYDPSRPLMDRYRAKAAELGVSVRTVQRWAAAVQRGRPGRARRRPEPAAADPLGGVDGRWVEMCRMVLAEHAEASRPTRELVLRRVAARLDAEHGPGTVPEPGGAGLTRCWPS